MIAEGGADGGNIARRIGIDAGAGLGSIVYALTRISSLLSSHQQLEQALTISRWISERAIASCSCARS